MLERKIINALPIHSIADLEKMGELIATSQMFGQINPAQGAMVAMILWQKNMSADDFIRQYDFLKSKLSMKASTILSRFRALGGKATIDTYTDTEVAMTFSYRENQDKRFSLTLQEVTEKGLNLDGNGKIKSTWAKHTRQMLYARVISEACSRLCPEACSGIYTPEEVSDFDTNDMGAHFDADVTPADPMPQPPPVQMLDPSVCPFECDFKGKRWEELSDELLNSALIYDGTPPACKTYIKNILQIRQRTKESEQ